jgi:putative transposase
MRRVPENRAIGGLTYFVTSRLNTNRPIFEESKCAQLILDTLNFYRKRGDIDLYGFVIMPDHVHLVVRLNGEITISWWMDRFKSYIARKLGKGPIWQQGYWSEVVPNIAFLEQKLQYIHNNPVRAEIVERAEDFEWSSARDYFCQETSDRIDCYR